jgi:hypothetical protein
MRIRHLEAFVHQGDTWRTVQAGNLARHLLHLKSHRVRQRIDMKERKHKNHLLLGKSGTCLYTHMLFGQGTLCMQRLSTGDTLAALSKQSMYCWHKGGKRYSMLKPEDR